MVAALGELEEVSQNGSAYARGPSEFSEEPAFGGLLEGERQRRDGVT